MSGLRANFLYNLSQQGLIKDKPGEGQEPKEVVKKIVKGPKMSKVERKLLLEKDLMQEYGFLKHMVRNPAIGEDKVGWPEKIKILFEEHDLKMKARDIRDQLEKEKKAEARKVRPH